ncbi:family 43 glycosylhydrolase [Actinoalloteichus caeruleus]|uniref:Concanavalin A-like lectin/glucanases superfamily protein n=1 Tax=Actinoalloteichus caeruleus DSM 43889 TaxID=1120930 RepID=A0ABT1JD30_ACTCY|nr:family 43 glycosylhydrolase [Actinoalloteichus caeruleus]MCP2330134.1 Concanavalin A-like lectin/glucanases superfamily protein [Actinoalloteichus caeruleus DSM 43889]
MPHGRRPRPARHRLAALVAAALTPALVAASLWSETATATPHPAPPEPEAATEPYAGYLFAYFTGEGRPDGEQVYFALSRGNDPLRWDELNDGQPVLSSTLGDEGVRDPFLIRSPEGDRFYLIATDLRIHGNGDWDGAQRHGSRSIMVWDSTDLVSWSEQRSVEVSPPNAGNTWAPKAHWSEELDAYVVFWASKLYAEDDPDHTGTSHNRMMYATTRDFVSFSEAQVWHDPGHSVIDSAVIEHEGVYHRFTKDERDPDSSSPCAKFLVAERSTELTSISWDFVADCVGRASEDSPGVERGEGPAVFRANSGDRWHLFIDEFGGRGYVPFETTDLDSGRWTMSSDYRLPPGARHGSVIPLTQAEHDRLAGGPVPPVEADESGLVAHWPLDGAAGEPEAGSRAVDVSGHGYHGTLHGDVRWVGDALEFGGTDGHVALPDHLLSGLDAVTVSADVWVDPAQPTPYFLYGFGNTDRAGVGDGYLFATGGTEDSGLRAALATGDWSTEQQVAAERGLPRGGWRHLTHTVDGGTAVLYLDGVEVARNEGITIRPGDIGGGRTTANYLGRSQYSADHHLTGRLRDVRLHNRALSAEEVAGLSRNGTVIRGVDLPELAVPAVIDPVGATVTLPVEPGTRRHWLSPVLELAPGASVSPDGRRRVDLREPLTYTVTSPSGASRDWTVVARELRTPVLPGYHADPDIAVFGDTYYLYPTTDGFPGWGSTTFSVFSSKDLVNWTDHGVILDLGTDVPWADRNAWAPTIAERDGRYYFYFTAAQQVGVAVADSPLGPFEDVGAPLVSANPGGVGQAIDPAAFVDEDGQAYLYWGNGAPFVVPLNEDMVSFDPSSVRRLSGLDEFREGLFVVRRGDTYHLTYSIDDTRSPDYRVGYATADSPLGPFTSHGVILSGDPAQGILGTGHNSVLRVPGTDDWYIAYHRFAVPDGDGTHRETTLDRLTFGADGLAEPVVPTLEGVAPHPVPVPSVATPLGLPGCAGTPGRCAPDDD